MSKKIRLSPSGKEINAEESDTVLSALEKAGLALPNNCRAGACGECKVKVLSGKFDQGFVLDMALSQEERSQGMGLMCMAKITGDVLEIQWEGHENGPKLFPPEEDRSYIVVEKTFLTAKIVRLKIRSLTNPMRFWPGQFIRLTDPQSGTTRSYSLASVASKDGELELLISKVSGGQFSNWIHDQLKEGDLIRVGGPYGTFIGKPGEDRPVLCLCHGSGLAPILSLAQGALIRGGFRRPAHILFSVPKAEDLIERGKLAFLARRFRNFSFRYTTTQMPHPEGGPTGRIPKILPELYPDLSHHSVYIAGSADFVESVSEAALKCGTDPAHLHREKFL